MLHLYIKRNPNPLKIIKGQEASILIYPRPMKDAFTIKFNTNLTKLSLNTDVNFRKVIMRNTV